MKKKEKKDRNKQTKEQLEAGEKERGDKKLKTNDNKLLREGESMLKVAKIKKSKKKTINQNKEEREGQEE